MTFCPHVSAASAGIPCKFRNNADNPFILPSTLITLQPFLFAADMDGERTGLTTFLNGTTTNATVQRTYTYENDGSPEAVTWDPTGGGDDSSATYSYDNWGEVTMIQRSDSGDAFDYGCLSQFTTTNTYDDAGDLTGIADVEPSPAYKVGAKLTVATYSGTGPSGATYDADGRLTAYDDSFAGHTSYTSCHY
jgi:hypothetical protein